ncbi:protein of unknown function [Maridesulfovibrio hydrothermalis AM13 = DSM 14728]|uniref:Uncharacterized protein n=1 Tax=Maridesulfovibrio hydrothermalis AM13 = DSM 14728 TaxID=1121451 RepID=L0REZ2_9BACT|nr:protein of unknown function [Maridesulfovibrio hydrothermalis AM13 = DSM 14728]
MGYSVSQRKPIFYKNNQHNLFFERLNRHLPELRVDWRQVSTRLTITLKKEKG